MAKSVVGDLFELILKTAEESWDEEEEEELIKDSLKGKTS